MENKKDLSKAFSIIFGIKPEEVPSKSSGNVNYFKELRIIKNDNLSKSIRNKKDVEEFMKQLENIKENEKWLSRDQTRALKDVGDSTYEKALNDKESIVKDLGKFYRDEEKMKELYDKIENNSKKLPMTVEGIRQQLEEYSNMENSSKTLDEDNKSGQKENEKLEIMRDLAEGVGVLPVNLQDKEYRDLKSSDRLKMRSEMEDAELGSIGRDSRKYLTEEDCRQQAKEQSRFLVGSIAHQPSPKTARDQTENVKYQVNFKADKASILISENMFNQLCEANTPINGKILNPLLWASDEDTGEMICLDSSSILSITKFK